MVKKIFLVLCLYMVSISARAMTDNQLMAEVARTGQLLQQMQFDSALAQVDRLLPIAKENRNVLAQAVLHGVEGLCLSRQNRQQAGMQAYMRSAAIVERHHLLQPAVNDTTGTMLAMFAVMYGEMSLRYQELGNTVEGLNYAYTALRWVSYADSPSLRTGVMACIMPALAANKEWRQAYGLMKQAFSDAIQLRQYDLALVMAASLMTCEDEAFDRGPPECEWMGLADKLLPLATTHEAKEEYTNVRQKLISKYAGEASLPDHVEHQGNRTAEKSSGSDSEAPQDSLDVLETSLTAEDGPYDSPLSSLLLWGLSVILLLLITSFLWYRYVTQKKRKETSRQMAEKYVEGQEYERNRLARELHDGVSNQLLAVEMKLSTDGLTQDTMQLLDESREQVRRVSHELVQPEFSHATLDQVLASYVTELNGVRQCDISFSTSPSQADWSFIPAATALEIYRIVQELVANALKHSQATIISVGLHQDERQHVMVLVSDNSEEQEPAVSASSGIGLPNIRHRAEAVGATLEFMHHQYGRVAKLVISV